MSNIKDVASMAGVSVPTVYKAFSTTYYTSPEIQDRVFAAAKQLGYVHKTSVKKEEQPGNKVLAIFLDEIVNPFYEEMLKETAKEMERFGYVPMIMYSYNNPDIERQNFELAISHKCDGIIFVPAPNGDKKLISKLAAKHFPLVQLYRTVYPELDTLLIDDELGTYLAVRHLIQSGHKRILMVAKTNPAIYIHRELGYARAFEEAGLPVDDNCIYMTNYVDCAKEMIKQKVNKTKPTAILAAGEGISINVLQALSEMNISIPEDMSFILYDNVPWASIYGITTVAHSYEKIGRLVVEMIHHQFEKQQQIQEEAATRLVLDPTLEARKSVRILL